MVEVTVTVDVTDVSVVCVVVRVEDVSVVTEETVVAVLTVVLVVAVSVVRVVWVVVVVDRSEGSTAANIAPPHETLNPLSRVSCMARAEPAPASVTVSIICVPPMHTNVMRSI